jgi:hypothetical protein
VAADDERLGRISLWTSIVGLLLPVVLMMVFAVLLERNILHEWGKFHGLCLLLGGVLELAALGCGLGARRTAAGKGGLLIAVVSVVLLMLVTAIAVPRVQMAPVQEQVETGCSAVSDRLCDRTLTLAWS